jgi:putative transposase
LEAAQNSSAAPLRIERFAARFAAWADWYNGERPHRMLDGHTPLQAWNEDPSPLHRIDAEQVRHLLLADAERVVAKDGIHFNGLTYLAPEISGRVGQTVEIRYMPHDERSIEVYLAGAHLATAFPSNALSADQLDAWRDHQRAEARRLGAERRKAARRARTELAPMVDGSSAEPSRAVPRDQAAIAVRTSTDAALRAASSTSLLGLNPRASAEQQEA